jgi:ankyrin repeat protein
VTTRMTAPRLARLVADGDADAVRTAVAGNPALLARTVDRDGQGGWTPLHVAVAEGGADVVPASAAYLDDVEALGDALADGSAADAELLAWAAAGGAAGTARLLLERAADADDGALHAAARHGRVEMVRLLLAAGADPDHRDPDTGRSALHDVTTNDGASALDISHVAAARHRRGDAGRATGNDALADLLVAHGARE